MKIIKSCCGKICCLGEKNCDNCNKCNFNRIKMFSANGVPFPHPKLTEWLNIFNNKFNGGLVYIDDTLWSMNENQ